MSKFCDRIRDLSSSLCAAILLLLLAGCAKDRRHELVISVPGQNMVLYRDGQPVKTYPVSTSKFGIGNTPGSYTTPPGRMEIARKIGKDAPEGAVFKDRRRTGEIVAPGAPGRDPIVTRILWLRGLEEHNRNAFDRHIYIHGTPQEDLLGTPASYGCIRMKSSDVAELFDVVGVGARVTVVEGQPAARPH
jgi:lipoprotein-anchoring transpeptidase ErfK/SrfK